MLGSYKHFMFSLTGFVFLAQPFCSRGKVQKPRPRILTGAAGFPVSQDSAQDERR